MKPKTLAYLAKPNPQNIKIIRHHWSKNIRMHVRSDGTVVVTVPKLAPKMIINAAIAKHDKWIAQQQAKLNQTQNKPIEDGAKIGKNHVISFVTDNKLSEVKSSVKQNKIIIKLPSQASWNSEPAQAAAKKAETKALRAEAEEYLPERLSLLADLYNYNFSSVRIRKLERRWGSCSGRKDITFNLQLMSLPNELIDYVIMHELTHTNHLHHQADFWAEMQENMPNYKDLRKQIKNYHV